MFGGRGSIRLLTIAGIRIGVDASWFVILFLAIFWLSRSFGNVLGGGANGTAFTTAVITALLFFLSLLLHELGHAFVARRHGIRVPQIDLWLLGGMARMERDARTPGEEFSISIAGPIVSLLLAALCVGIGVVLDGWTRFWSAASLEGGATITPTFLVLSFLATMNVIIFLFNLVPAWPLDGGRIARAIAWKATGDRGRATRIAAGLGTFFAWLMAAWGLWLIVRGDLGGLWWLLLAFFIGQAARGAVAQTRFTDSVDGVTVADIMDRQPVSVPADLPVVRAEDEFFLRYRWSWFPVVDTFGRFVGLAQEERVRGAARSGDGTVRVEDVMDRTAAADWRIEEDEPLEALLASEPLRRHGALMAVDGRGVLRGVVTVEQVRRALQDAAPGGA